MKDYTLVLTDQEANLVTAVLSKQPYDLVFQLINKVQSQINEQNRIVVIPRDEAGT